MASITPARQQYLKIKEQHPDAILLFRMGDFYETFDEDARVAARELEIALTSREMGKGQRVPLAGIPYHAWTATWRVWSSAAIKWLFASRRESRLQKARWSARLCVWLLPAP